jgi:hypothetical protein
MVDCLPSKHEALSSNTGMVKKKKYSSELERSNAISFGNDETLYVENDKESTRNLLETT